MRRAQAGFTLIELMIVVAIVGILSSLAIPSFYQFHLRSKAAEAKGNLAAIRTAEEAYFGEFGTYVSAAPTPASVPGTRRAPWGGSAEFDELGWAPEGDVYYSYRVVTPAGATAALYTAEACSDIDGDAGGAACTNDSRFNVWAYFHSSPSGAVQTGVWCAQAGVSNGRGGLATDVVGPCQPLDGMTEF